MPVFAVDIDGTISTYGPWFARWMTREFGLPITEEQLAGIRYGYEWWELPQVRALTKEQRQDMRKVVREHQHDVEQHRHAVPIPFAAVGLRQLRQYGDILYTTCRQESSREVTRAWLEQYGFPDPGQVVYCQHYHWKYVHAYEKAGKNNPIVLIDDTIETIVKAFRQLVLSDRGMAIALVRYLVLVAFGRENPPQFPATMKIPFPILALPSWQEEDLRLAFGDGATLRVAG